jgi:hypothetical protein
MDEFVSTSLDSMLLIGILLTAVFSIFKVGRWFQNMVGSIDLMTRELCKMQKALDSHIVAEDQRFNDIEGVLLIHQTKCEEIRAEVKRLSKLLEANGAARGRAQ